MSKLKRKASQQLTRNSVPVIKFKTTTPTYAPPGWLFPEIFGPLDRRTLQSSNMFTAMEYASRCLFWVKDRVTTTYAQMVYGTTEIVADNHIQVFEARPDGAAAIKRQRVARLRKSKSTGDKPSKRGLRTLDYTGCTTDEDYQARNDAFWAPPELGFLKGLDGAQSRMTPPLSDEEDEQEEHRGRRLSSPAVLPMTPESLSPKSDFRETPSRYAPVTQSQNATTWLTKLLSPPESKPSTSLLERMDKLFLSHDDSHEPSHVLMPSAGKSAKRELQAQERKEKEREEVNRALKNLRLSRRRPLKPLIQPLSRNWEKKVAEAQWTNDHQRVITTSIGGTELRRKDFLTLLGSHAWLNDEIINTYLEWMVDAANKTAVLEAKSRGESATTVPRFIAHNSFFYQNLISKGASNTQGLMRRKKAPGVALMEVDSVLVPICKGSHWTVGVVRPIAKSIEYFDSMGGDPRPFTRLMRSWLQFQLGDQYLEEEWTEPGTACALQTNGYDCGVFVCTNSFCVVLGLDTSCYRERDMELQRRNIAAVLLNRGFIKDFEWGQAGL